MKKSALILLTAMTVLAARAADPEAAPATPPPEAAQTEAELGLLRKQALEQALALESLETTLARVQPELKTLQARLDQFDAQQQAELRQLDSALQSKVTAFSESLAADQAAFETGRQALRGLLLWTGSGLLLVTALLCLIVPARMIRRARGEWRKAWQVTDEAVQTTRVRLENIEARLAQRAEPNREVEQLLLSAMNTPAAQRSERQAGRLAAVAADRSFPPRYRLTALAVQAQDRKDWHTAHTYWKALLAIAPDDAPAVAALGRCQQKISGTLSTEELVLLLEKAVAFHRAGHQVPGFEAAGPAFAAAKKPPEPPSAPPESATPRVATEPVPSESVKRPRPAEQPQAPKSPAPVSPSSTPTIPADDEAALQEQAEMQKHWHKAFHEFLGSDPAPPTE